MLYFTRYTMPRFQVNWHHSLMCWYLNEFVRGNITRLMIFAPPRHTKTELGSRRLPAFMFGHDPDEEIIAATYSDELSVLNNRDVQRIMDSYEYRELFPNSKLPGQTNTVSETKWIRNNNIFEIVNHRGKYQAVGVGGSVTGKGATTIIIDDPHKNQAEADSKTYRDKIYDWYTASIHTRLINRPEKPAKILLMMTRWHQDDLAGRLLSVAASDPKADQWEVLNLPAVKEDHDANDRDDREVGEALWPFQNDLESLEKIKAGSLRVFSALYQGRPSPPTGLIIKRDWFKFYKIAPEFHEVILSADLTFDEGVKSDYVVLQVWGRNGANKYLLDQTRAKMNFTATISAFKTMTAKWPQATTKVVEKAANGAALITTLQTEIAGIVPYKPTSSKVARAQAISPQFEAGNVFLPDPSIAPWIHEYVEEWMDFPNGMHDDQVDATTQALLRMEQSKSLDWDPPGNLGLTQASKWKK